MNWLIPGALAVLALGGGLLGLKSCHSDPRIHQANASAVTAVAQDQVHQATTAIAAQSQTKTLHIEVTTKEAARAVQIAAGADAPLPPDVLARWGDGIDGVRAQALAAHTGPATGASPGDLPPAVPPP